MEAEIIETGEPSNGRFTSFCTVLKVNESKITLRVLKMTGSTLVILSDQLPEILNEMGVALYQKETKEVLGTTILGGHATADSEYLARKLSKRFNRQFFVSCNMQEDRMMTPLIERQLCDYIKNHEEQFA